MTEEIHNALHTQVGGNHYSKMAITPFEYAYRNHLDPISFSIVKYVSRFRDKNGREDLEKAKNCIDQLIALEYGE